MKTNDFSFTLPAHLIVQTPIKQRDHSRLLCMSRDTGSLRHKHFHDLPDMLRGGDLLVLNDSRVMPARLIGRSATNSEVEVLLLRNIKNQTWECLTKPGKKTKRGAKLYFRSADNATTELAATVTDISDNGNRIIEFQYDGDFTDILNRLGQMPLPPYISETLQDPERYQTVYSKQTGSAAAPTAGLHFTNELLGKIKNRGINIAYITLHVGPGTFRPVKTEKIEDHVMHSEYYTIPEETAALINQTKNTGGRVIAVGTTTCRTLESTAGKDGKITAQSGDTDIFIYPGYKFKCIDGLITNFHLPESTLIMLVSAFAGREQTLNAYHEAIAEEYRFYSFGDAMLIM